MKRKSFGFFALALAIPSLFAIAPSVSASSVQAFDGPTISNEGDFFSLTSKQYAANESFVYTADLHFNNGQAGGLAFGAQENDHYFVINMDRYENHVKLMYFASNGSGGYNVDVLREADFIGNEKMTSQERAMVAPRVHDIQDVNIKVILSIEDEHAYVELFVEGIKRFGVDSIIDLNDLGKPYTYQGGYLGMNVFAGSVSFSNVEYGKSDYSYFSEQYRNQYHLQPFTKWTNDPNALCYHNGYYHVFYQTNPFGLLWGDMYWGHARSVDLIHFEFLPICLFPEKEGMGFGPGDAFMWSGCAISYEYGMSSAIDEQNWFPNGGGNGLLAIYTRDGGLQDQVVISSDDEGITWTKRHRIPQNISGYDNKIDFRDPKVFPMVKDGSGNVTLWAMTLSSYNLNKGWFLKSSNLLDWEVAGSFPLPTPECIGVGFLKDEHDNTHAYLTNKSRTYILGDLVYDEMSGKIIFTDENGIDISTYTVDNIPLKPLDFGPDTYASQSFYINDPVSEFYGKDIVLNWFSGDLNASFCTGPGEYAGLRGRWNGGFTVPVEYGLKESTEGLRITQKPITVNNANLEKTNIVNIAGETLDASSDNPLADVDTHVFEMDAAIQVNDDSPITFRVDVGNNEFAQEEYMEFGWNETDGYYVDRTNLDDKGISTNVDWHVRYSSHILGDSDVKTFYVLSDNGGLEVFCEDYSVSFYFVTTASIYSTSADLKADDALINKLEINEVKSVYRQPAAPGEGVLYVASTDVELGTTFMQSKFVTCWFSGVSNLVWDELLNDDVVSYVATNKGISFTALKPGVASFKVSVGEQEKVINVTVYDSYLDGEFSFNDEDIVSGKWIMKSNSLVGEIASGNAFLLSEQGGSDFTYAGQFDIVSGTAASLIFRAASDMSTFLAANYDINEHVVKLWSKNGELARSEVLTESATNVVLLVKAVDRNIKVSINGKMVIDYNYAVFSTEPLSGRFGLNVFSGKAIFKNLTIVEEDYQYSSGDLKIALSYDAYVTSIINATKGNTLVQSGFYYQEDNSVFIREDYFKLLTNGKYKFKINSTAYSFEIYVDVDMSVTPHVDDVTIDEGFDAIVYIGSIVVTSVKVNGAALTSSDYTTKNYTLTIKKGCLNVGENEVVINDSINFVINVISTSTSGSTSESTSEPTSEPSSELTSEVTSEPTSDVTSEATSDSTSEPTSVPTSEPTSEPTSMPTSEVTSTPTSAEVSTSTSQGEQSSQDGVSPLVFIIPGSVVLLGGIGALVYFFIIKKRV